jgi:hypothetical protein
MRLCMPEKELEKPVRRLKAASAENRSETEC